MKFITMTAVGALIAGAAHAGGIAPAPSEPLVMAPATPVAATNWTGGYAGASLGYGAVDADGSPGLEDNDFGFDGDDNFDDDEFDIDIDGDGAVGGVYGGYQYDFGSFVVGGEADLNAANLDFDDDGIGDFIEGGTDSFDNDGGASIDQIHRLKLRAGYDAGSALIYGVVGAAYAEAEIFEEDFSDTGYVVGAGVDYQFRSNITLGGEVLYHQWDDFDDTGIDFEATTAQVRVGYQF